MEALKGGNEDACKRVTRTDNIKTVSFAIFHPVYSLQQEQQHQQQRNCHLMVILMAHLYTHREAERERDRDEI